MSNPFQQSMVKMRLPAHMGSSIAASGFTLEADADGCIEVPKAIALELESHGLERVSESNTTPKAKK